VATVYLIGDPKNINSFCNAEMVAKFYGHTVINPMYVPEILELQDAMIDASDAVILLNGWKNCDSAKRQFAYSQNKDRKKADVHYNSGNVTRMKEALQNLKGK
jgi:hypothetical protein